MGKKETSFKSGYLYTVFITHLPLSPKNEHKVLSIEIELKKKVKKYFKSLNFYTYMKKSNSLLSPQFFWTLATLLYDFMAIFLGSFYI